MRHIPTNNTIGVIICKLDPHRAVMRGYIAMLAVDKDFRKRRIGSTLVELAIEEMKKTGADEVSCLFTLHSSLAIMPDR